MLQVQNITKEYRTGTLVQRALDGVSLNLRDNEFVAILGPSGSGKTTLLNVLGGLDRYDSGDLVINGTSTKKYSDRDWDSYRNHTVGFVFQSYNLIPHQTVLANVELALTIAGISKAEIRRRAEKALDQVGLSEHIHKKPNQLSGGQMQRVAIARALINDPDILLADEPTGALDSDTSVQVMDLLKEVAKDRLVVMVTHNPELAEEYATRIVNLKDGKITGDSDPFIIDDNAMEPAVHRNLGKASMSFLTALGLSFNNLRTKLARTILVSFAGSIGIIGIALILSLSTGVNRYIDTIEEETLSEYPVQIYKTSMDFTSMIMRNAPALTGTDNREKPVLEYQTVTNMFTNVNKNDLMSFRKHIEENQALIDTYTKAVEYKYSITPLIYREEEDGVRKVNPDETFTAMGFGSQAMNTMQMFNMSSDSFYQLPANTDLYEDQYLIKAGRWPEKYNEVVLVLAEGDMIPDLTLYIMGLKDTDELDQAVKDFSDGKDVKMSSEIHSYSYEDFLKVKFKLVNNVECYQYDDNYGVWSTRTDNKEYMKDLVARSEDIHIVGVVAPDPDAKVAMLQFGLGYRPELIDHIVSISEKSEIVQQQLEEPGTNVFTGKLFSEDESSAPDLSNMFSLNPDAIKNAFKFDTRALAIDPSKITAVDIDLSGLSGAMNSASFNITEDQMTNLFNELMTGYQSYTNSHPETSVQSLAEGYQEFLSTSEGQAMMMNFINEQVTKAMSSITEQDIQDLITNVMAGYQQYAIDNELTDPTRMTEYIQQYLQTPEAQAALSAGLSGLLVKAGSNISQDDIAAFALKLNDAYTGYADKNDKTSTDDVLSGFSKYMASDSASGIISKYVSEMVDTSAIEKEMSSAIQKVMASYMKQMSSMLSKNLQKAFKIDTDAFASAFSMNMTEQDLQDLMTSLMGVEMSSYEDNLRRLGYAKLGDPSEIDIYPISFESKDQITEFISAYNEDMESSGHDDRVIQYTDMVGTMMSSVTDIINAISYVLIAFVSISLIVSSIMIGVITYISVLERRKEIGILRAIGASKHNVAQVFNAETFIIGSLAGIFGIVISRLILIPGNMVISHLTTAPIRAVLPLKPALLLILLSIMLTLIGGIIPSRKAAKQDPVTALRTE